MKKIFLIIFILFAAVAYAEDTYPVGSQLNIDGSALGWDEANQVWRPIAVDATGKLSSGSNPAVASISIDTSNIDNKLVATFTGSVYPYPTSNKSVAEMLKLIYQEYESITRTTEFNTLSMIYSTISNMYTVPTDINTIKKDISRIAKGSQPNRLYMSRLSVNANSHYQILPLGSSSIDNGRVFVELRAIDPDAEFYIGLDAMVTDLTGRPVKGRILINISADQDLYIYHTNATALAIQQTEGWN